MTSGIPAAFSPAQISVIKSAISLDLSRLKFAPRFAQGNLARIHRLGPISSKTGAVADRDRMALLSTDTDVGGVLATGGVVDGALARSWRPGGDAHFLECRDALAQIVGIPNLVFQFP